MTDFIVEGRWEVRWRAGLYLALCHIQEELAH